MNEIYDTFLKTFTGIYDANFTIREYILKDKDIKFPLDQQRFKEILKDKTKVTHQIEAKTLEDESKYKNCKGLFEKLRKKKLK